VNPKGAQAVARTKPLGGDCGLLHKMGRYVKAPLGRAWLQRARTKPAASENAGREARETTHMLAAQRAALARALAKH